MYNEEKKSNCPDPIFRAILRRKKDAAFVLFGILLGVLFEWTAVEIMIFSIFIWSILGPIYSRYLAWPALFFLVFTPILQVLERKEQAEEFAIYAYYFLVMIVIRGIIEIRQETKKGD